MDIRLSMGSATSLGLRSMRMDTPPATLYTMLGEKCTGACTFCTQAINNSANRKFLSRVVWPTYDIDDVTERLRKNKVIHRICVQTLKDPNMLALLPQVIERLHTGNIKPISVCMNPVDRSYLLTLKNTGVERVGIGLDCATQESFSIIKPGFSWGQYQGFIADTVDVFGHGSVHLIVGLGDSDEDLIQAFQRYTDINCSIGLFALTPVRGTRLSNPAPPIERYRTLQFARYLISSKQINVKNMVFEDGKLHSMHVSNKTVEQALSSGIPFRTSGCPDCNRPNYNERPGGIMYNYAEPLEKKDIAQAFNELGKYITLS